MNNTINNITNSNQWYNNSTHNNTFNLPKAHIIPISVHICESISTSIFNVLVIFIYITMKDKVKNKIANYLMLAQSLVDMYQGCVSWFETLVEILFRKNIISSLKFIHTIYAGKFTIRCKRFTYAT